DRKLDFRETVHGPVIGYARVNCRRVAISADRSTRGRELLSALAFQDLNTNRVHDVASFYRSMNRLEFTFNWVYADDKNIALFSSGRLPIRAPGVASGLPTDGTGNDDWRRFEPLAAHIHGTAPQGGVISAAKRRDHQLEQQVGPWLLRVGRQLVVRPGPARPVAAAKRREAAGPHARVARRRDEHDRDAGSARRLRHARDRGGRR